MKYFVTNSERNGTCYHEFYIGKWDGSTFWKHDSLYLGDDILFANKGFIDAITEVILSYNPFGETEVSSEDWTKIGEIILRTRDDSCKELYQELNAWLLDVFKTNDCFTILGI